MDELKLEAVRGFKGFDFYEAEIYGRKHLVIVNGAKCIIQSREPISEKSEEKYGMYVTECSIDELENLYKSSLKAIYMGQEFDVGMVSAGVEKVELLSRGNIPDMDERALGFTDDLDMGARHKFVSSVELDSILVSRESIYDKVRANIEEKKNTMTM